MDQRALDEVGECIKLLMHKEFSELTPAEQERVEAVKPQILERLDRLTQIIANAPLI